MRKLEVKNHSSHGHHSNRYKADPPQVKISVDKQKSKCNSGKNNTNYAKNKGARPLDLPQSHCVDLSKYHFYLFIHFSDSEMKLDI